MNQPARAIERAPQRLHLDHEISGVRRKIAVHHWGSPDAERVVLCLHALNRNGRDFDFLAQALADEYRVLCLDLPGRGDSDRLADSADYNHQAYLRILDAVIESAELRGRPIDIIGTSLGGILGIMYAAEHPAQVRRLVLNDVGTETAAEVFLKAARSIMREVRFRSMDQAILTFKIMTASCGPLTDAEWRAVSAHMLEPTDDGGYTLRYDPRIADQLFRDAESDLDLWHWYDRIRAQVLLIRGANSDVLSEDNARAMALRRPCAERYTVAGTGHFPMLIKQDEINAVKRFLI